MSEITNCPKCNSTRLDTKLKCCRDCWWHYGEKVTVPGKKKHKKLATNCKVCGSTELYRPSAYCHRCYLDHVNERLKEKKAKGWKRER